MMKTTYLTILLTFLLGAVWAQQNQVDIVAQVFSLEGNTPLAGAVIKEKEGTKTAISDQNGRFELSGLVPNSVLVVSFIGFETVELTASELQAMEDGILYLQNAITDMDQVTVLSTGYQQIPKERATGSYVSVDKELINRKVSTNLLDRLEDVTPSLIFNRGNRSSNDAISIRGRSTLFAETQPLIVIDNFPYDGPLENINPNDVESITVLRDAASASIWGARSGNGVIVIKTKSGAFNSPMNISLNANINITEKPDLFARPQMAIGDFIAVEQQLFDNGSYNSRINQSARPPLSPGVEAMLAFREGQITEQEKNNFLAAYNTYDSREQLLSHFYRPSQNQQYSLNINGGSAKHRYNISLGTDFNLHEIPGNQDRRFTLNSQNDWKLLKDKLEIGSSVSLVQSSRQIGNTLPDMGPYERLVDESGNPLPVIRDFNTRYVSALPEQGFLDGSFVPLNEIGLISDRGDQLDLRLNTTLAYRITPWIKASLLHQYWNNTGETRLVKPSDSYDVRWLINRFTQFDDAGSPSYPVPLGGTLNQRLTKSTGNYLRGQLTFNPSWNGVHELNGIVGGEMKDVSTLSTGSLFYGYDDDFGLSLPVDYQTRFQINPNSSSTIPRGDSHSGAIDRFISLFANASYSYQKKYIVSASARRDASNLFGVNTNMRAVPLWSAGLGWVLSEENFFQSGFLPYLKLRSTFGYNGNVDRSTSAFTTANYFITASFSQNPGERAAVIQNPPNPDLRWERVKMWNTALDFSLKNDLVDGSIEFYIKDGIDLIGDIPVAPSLGESIFRGNFASTRTKGFDIALNARPLQTVIQWDVNFFISHLKEEVTDYEIQPQVDQMVSGLFTVPVTGNPLFGLYSFPWGGLDPDTGQPRGILDDEPSTDYRGIRRGTSPEDLIFHGSTRPTSFGALRNTLSYKGISLSVNVSYRLGYYFRRNSVDYSALLSGRITHADFNNKWENAGDEVSTSIPGLPADLRVNANRQFIYNNAEVLAERGDHIRLQDIRLAYRLDRGTHPWLPFSNAELYSYVNNLGIIWKKTEHDIDPDFQNIPPSRSIAFGLRVNF
ncbi:SusC/RagA family TonB-linked outer membrane protein [Algoriphagus yeomjeoni]|uniref:SusC/RagA family TonB-linked outer membrane protein n=1 Tax=Algoriphagus yeomjeoni TaxID=291403 RepID=UPI003CE4F5C3